MKKTATWFLLVVMLFACCTGALAVTDENGIVYPGYEGEYADPGYSPVTDGEPVTVRIAHRSDANLTYFGNDTETDNWFTRMLEKQLNIDIDYTQLLASNEYDTVLGLMIAADVNGTGELPDAMVVTKYSDLVDLIEADKLMDLSEVYDKYASAYLKNVYTYSETLLGSSTFQGKLYGIPSVDSSDGSCAELYIRKDWLDKLGLDVPKTVEDLKNVARAFMTKDPDGNGVDDTWGIAAVADFYRAETGWGATTASLEGIFNAFNSFPTLFYWNDDKSELLYGGLQPETKDALGCIRDMFAEGLIIKDFTTTNWDQINEACLTDKCGLVFSPWWQCVGSEMALEGKYWGCYAVPLNDEGKYINAQGNATGQYIVVNKNASPEVAEAVVKICNIQSYTGGRMMCNDILPELRAQADYQEVWFANTYFPFLCNIDQGNKHSALAADAEAYYAGKLAFEDMAGEAQGLVPFWDQLYAEPFNGDIPAFLASGTWEYGVNNQWCVNCSVYLENLMALHKAQAEGNLEMKQPATFRLSQSESWVDYGATLKKTQLEYFTKIVTGELELDAFDEFVNQWLNLGGQDVIDELTDYVNSL